MPIVEDHLEELVREGQAAGRLRFVVGAAAAVEGAEFVFLCVPTPQGDDGSADLSYVEAVAKEIGPLLVPGTIIVNKSTVPVGSTLVVERVLGRRDITVVSNPEFLREGTAVPDSLHPERIVVGADDQAAAAKVGELFAGTQAPLLITDAATAETIKYASNAFLATKLSFVNAVAGLCEAVGADVRDVILGLGYDKRIGFEYLRPGPGWGGSCLPKDTRALVHIADQAGYDFSFLKGAIATNEEQFARVVDKVAHRGRRRPRGCRRRGVGPHLQGRHRRPAQLAGRRGRPPAGGRRGPSSRPSTPPSRCPRARSRRRSRSCRLSPDTDGPDRPDDRSAPSPTPMPPARVPPPWWCSPSGTSSAGSTSPGCGISMAAPVVVDARNLLDPAQLRRIGFEYTGHRSAVTRP